MKVLLSYPRSGNHLVRFFMELLTEVPTHGCIENKTDTPIHKNRFPEHIPFNIDEQRTWTANEVFTKYHTPPLPHHVPTDLILIVRNPKEVLIRHKNMHTPFKHNFNGWDGYNMYFALIEYYTQFNGNKKIFYYEDIISNKISFIHELCIFLHCKNQSKIDYVIENIDALFELSKQGKQRDWGGVNSDSIDYYYKKCNGKFKLKFDYYIACMINTHKYEILKNKYKL
jgi:hypothetical protein